MQKQIKVEWFSGGVTAPNGFYASGVKAGIKSNRKDMALIVSQRPAAAAGVFTLNRVKAAPVVLCRQRLKKSATAQAIIVNSGNANACTGKQGRDDAGTMAKTTAKLLTIKPSLVLVCSTGTIGIPLPIKKVACGIKLAVDGLSRTGGASAASAIMTTDTCAKQVAARLRINGKVITFGAMAKGAGMIAPNMATLLAFITTDACVESKALREALSEAVSESFNRILVDGDQSTNDTLLCLANGMAGNKILSRNSPAWTAFQATLTAVCQKLAFMIVEDGEGVTKVVRLEVKGAQTRAEAEKVARAIARSLLVKTSWFGADPNWGRVICAVGYSGAAIDPDKINISYDGREAVSNGKSSGLSPNILHKIITQKKFTLEVDLRQGQASYSMLTCDCSIDYVRINADYMT